MSFTGGAAIGDVADELAPTYGEAGRNPRSRYRTGNRLGFRKSQKLVSQLEAGKTLRSPSLLRPAVTRCQRQRDEACPVSTSRPRRWSTAFPSSRVFPGRLGNRRTRGARLPWRIARRVKLSQPRLRRSRTLRDFRRNLCLLATLSNQHQVSEEEADMDGLIYLIGLIVVVMFILSFFGLH